ncbi:hypothetical protein THAOC_27209 [Thalassiosira oceanica]|uniref:Uncharacterized protein n=1 Tax=Thalassiosira oceanica TaxID=159749 RepID=K0S396_THAOC|nr:hypothetical protein THAOC_27209 [Thalassiosira oceanica]|eukprot:EJK53372.1 hypothetical protein THAOC_27209 [Thalassiosira oceanica]
MLRAIAVRISAASLALGFASSSVAVSEALVRPITLSKTTIIGTGRGVPGVRPVGIGEALYRMIAKLVLTKARPDTKAACGSTQLCAGLEAGIEGALHSVRTEARADGSLNFEDDGAARDDERDAAQELEAQARDRPGARDSTADAEDESGDGPHLAGGSGFLCWVALWHLGWPATPLTSAAGD